jgi:hypothetical protein
MNEQIFKLALKAIDFQGAVDIDTELKLTNSELAKFAELIVAECTAALFDESERLSGLYSDEDNWDSAEEYEIRSNQCIDDIALIEKHFGVEE